MSDNGQRGNPSWGRSDRIGSAWWQLVVSAVTDCSLVLRESKLFELLSSMSVNQMRVQHLTDER